MAALGQEGKSGREEELVNLVLCRRVKEWRSGRLEDWKTGRLETTGATGLHWTKSGNVEGQMTINLMRVY